MTQSPERTEALGRAMGASLVEGLTIGLVGSLGAGKTALVRGMAEGNSVGDVRMVASPTFTLIHEYPGTVALVHIDAYRLNDSSSLLALGFDEFTGGEAAVVVEWANRVESIMPDDSVWIDIEVVGECSRRFRAHGKGQRSGRFLDAVNA